MSEQNTIPPEMLEAATIRYMLNQGHAVKTVKMHRQNDDPIWQNAQRYTRLILEAAGVPALLAKVAELEQLEQRETRILETIETEGFPLRPELAQFFDGRIAYFTAQESPRDEAVALAWSDYLIEVLSGTAQAE